MAFLYEDLEENIIRLKNAVGPEAIKQFANLSKPDVGKPLADGVRSRVEIIGGSVTYEEHKSDHPFFEVKEISGLKLPIVGGFVERRSDGMMHAHVDTAQAFPLMQELNSLLGALDGYEFYSSDEFISIDSTSPTIFQNLLKSTSPKGTLMRMPGVGEFHQPFTFHFEALTEAVGFVESGYFRGSMALEYDMMFEDFEPSAHRNLIAMYGHMPTHAKMSGVGTFEVKIS